VVLRASVASPLRRVRPVRYIRPVPFVAPSRERKVQREREGLPPEVRLAQRMMTPSQA